VNKSRKAGLRGRVTIAEPLRTLSQDENRREPKFLGSADSLCRLPRAQKRLPTEVTHGLLLEREAAQTFQRLKISTAGAKRPAGKHMPGRFQFWQPRDRLCFWPCFRRDRFAPVLGAKPNNKPPGTDSLSREAATLNFGRCRLVNHQLMKGPFHHSLATNEKFPVQIQRGGPVQACAILPRSRASSSVLLIWRKI